MPPVDLCLVPKRSMESFHRNGSTFSSTNTSSERAHRGPHLYNLGTALYDYDAQGEDELTLRKGQIVEVRNSFGREMFKLS